MMVNFKTLRPSPQYPTYPPYHNGPYLEEYFYDFYKKNKKRFDVIDFTLIPVFWTNLYLNGVSNSVIQEHINFLPKDQKYFTVCQFDDGIQEILPPNTINFVAGGNKPGIPIPLICSPISSLFTIECSKDILCSFVGTILHTEKYTCRLKLYEYYENDPVFYFTKPRTWSNNINENQFKEFINITRRSKFTLCPRGYGLQSFRLYEALQLNSIPVFVYDKAFFPFEKFIDWDSFCVRIHVDDIKNLKHRLLEIDDEVQNKMLEAGKRIYNEYFTLHGMCEGIYKELVELSS